MSNKTTNQKKGIVTRGSGHIAESSGVSLPYFETMLTGLVMDDNHIETSKCAVLEAAQRTFIAGHNVIHHESKIGIPFGTGASTYDRSHSVAQKAPPAYKFFAKSTENSPDTKVEGKWIVRTFDKTEQDGGNGPGKFSPGPGSTEIVDEDELLFQQCAVEKIKLECSHGRSTLEGELHVYIGDTVTVTAYRVNASETDPEKRLDVVCYITRMTKKKNPPAEETKHAAFVLTRNGRGVAAAIAGVSWEEIKNKTLVGESGQEAVEGSEKKAKISTLELKEDWLLEAEEEEGVDDGVDQVDLATNAEREGLEKKAKTAKRRVANAKKDTGRKNKGKIVNQARSASQRADANLAAFEADEERTKKNEDTFESLRNKASFILDSFKTVMAVYAYQPLQIQVEAHGCSPGANAVIKAYPVDDFGVDLTTVKDFAFTSTVAQVKHLVSSIADFFVKAKIDGFVLSEVARTGKKADIGGELFFFRGMKNLEDSEPVLNLVLGWKELERDTTGKKPRKAWQIHRAWELEVGLERLLGLKITFELDINLCLGIGRVFIDILNVLGIECGIFFVVDINLSAGVFGKVGVDQYDEWVCSAGGGVESVLKLSLAGKFGSFGKIELYASGEWAPEFALQKNDKEQAVIHRQESEFIIVVKVTASVDICGWDLSKEWEIHKWHFEVPEGDMVIFGGST
jgi:hypothetical protein